MEEKPRSVEEGGGCFYSYRSEDGPRRDCGYQADSCTLTRGANKGEYIRGLRLQFARLQHNQTETTISALQLEKLILSSRMYWPCHWCNFHCSSCYISYV